MACQKTAPVKRRFFRMDTVTDVIIYDNFGYLLGNKKINRCTAKIDSLLLEWENRFSASHTGSEVYEVNNRTSDTVTVSDEFYEMVQVAVAYGDSLNGLFDITVIPLKEYWNPSCKECADPDPGQDSVKNVVDSLLQNVDYKALTLLGKNRIAFKNRDVSIDLGGIAKGRVIQELHTLLKKSGLDNYLISAGGDILVQGKKRSGELFKVGVRDPRGEDLAAVFSLENGSVVTSGDYERFRIAESGERVHHLFDPRTGYPAKLNSSLTVVGEDPVIVDILSTALFVRSAPEVLDYINSRPQFECMVVAVDGEVYYSTGFKNEMNK